MVLTPYNEVAGPRLIDGRVGVEFFGVGGSRSARTLHYFALLFLGGFFFFWGGVSFGGVRGGGLITFFAGRLTRYSLGLAAALSTLLLHCTLPHAINFRGGLITFLAGRLARYSLGFAATLSTLLLHCALPHAISFRRGANNVLGWPCYKIFSWTCCYAIHSSLALYLKNCRHTKRKMAITKWAKVCNRWSSTGCGVKDFCRVLPKNWCHTLSIWWRNIMTFNNGFIHWNK